MESIEYFERPLVESGTVHKGETEVWFKDFVHDVYLVIHSTNVSFTSLAPTSFPKAYNPE